ncbi:MAG: type II toxin-antitoxin system RelE/ParE family toxin [Christensenellales bacterium]|jgi:toxin ParE1/3/4
MAKVVVLRAARNDLIHIQSYIRDELLNPDAARHVLGELRKAIANLQEMPDRGKPLDSVLSVHTEYRYLVCEQYRIFYLSNGDTVEIVRILHTLQDYMRVLFE